MKTKVFIMLASLALFFGCTSNNELYPPSTKDSRVTYKDVSLHEWLQLQSVKSRKNADGLLRFQAKFVNTVASDKSLLYRISWIDKEGFVQKSILSRWNKAVVKGNSFVYIDGISPNGNSRDYTLEVLNDTSVEEDPNGNPYNKH